MSTKDKELNLELFIKESKTFPPETTLKEINTLNVEEGYNHIVVFYEGGKGWGLPKPYIDVYRTSSCIGIFRIHNNDDKTTLEWLLQIAESCLASLYLQDEIDNGEYQL